MKLLVSESALGNLPSNKLKVLNKIVATNFSHRIMTISWNKTSANKLFQSGGTKGGKKRSRDTGKVIGSMATSDTLHLVWRGRLPKIEKHWQGIGESRTVSEDIVRELPVIDPDQLPMVEVITRDAIWATRTTDAMVLPAIEESSEGESDAEIAEEKKKCNKKKAKKECRSRTLTRTPTNEKQVPLTRYALHPTVTRGILNTLKAGWVVNYTPEAGVSTMACVKEGLFSVNVVKNEAHEKAINEYLLATIKKAFMTSGNPLHKASFKKRMTAVKEISEDSSSSASDSNPPDGSANDVSDDDDGDDDDGKKKKKIKKKPNPEEKQGEDDKEKKKRKKHDKENKTPKDDKEKKQPKGDTEGKKGRKRVKKSDPEDEEDGDDILNMLDGHKEPKNRKTRS